MLCFSLGCSVLGARQSIVFKGWVVDLPVQFTVVAFRSLVNLLEEIEDGRCKSNPFWVHGHIE